MSGISESKIYVIESALDTNYVMDLYGEKTDNGTNIQIYKKHGGINQQFKFIYDEESGYYEIVSMSAQDKSLNVYNGNTVAETNVQLWKRGEGCASYFKIGKNADNTYTIQSACSNLVLDIYGGKIGNEKNLQIFTSHGKNNQKWVLEEVGAS